MLENPAHTMTMRVTSQLRAPEDLKNDRIGARLRALREAHGIKPSEMAEMLGVERTYWTRWEKGTRQVPNDIAHKLTQLFNVDLDFIIAGDLKQVPVQLQQRLLGIDTEVKPLNTWVTESQHSEIREVVQNIRDEARESGEELDVYELIDAAVRVMMERQKP